MSGKYHRLSKGKDENGKRIFIDEHRYIMEQYLGRKLKDNEVVHHIDRNKSNNQIENLQVMTAKEHRLLHLKDTFFSDKANEKRRKNMVHRACITRRKITDEQLIKMLKDYKNGMKMRQIDRKYNLSNGTFGNILRGKNYYDKQEMIISFLNK